MTPASSAHLLPEPDGEEPLLHQREYVVRSYRAGPGRMRIRGMVHDQKPPGMIIDGDPDPLSVHCMVVDLLVDYRSLQIAAAEVVMEVTPHDGCTSIEPAYAELVGVSVTRGFSRKVQELFGGPAAARMWGPCSRRWPRWPSNHGGRCGPSRGCRWRWA